MAGAEEMYCRSDKFLTLTSDHRTIKIQAIVGFLEGESAASDYYNFYYERRDDSESLTFPCTHDGLLEAVIGIKRIKDGQVFEKDKEFRISRKGDKITISLIPPYGDPKKPDKPEEIVVALDDAVSFSNKVSKRVDLIRKVFKITPKVLPGSKTQESEKKERGESPAVTSPP